MHKEGGSNDPLNFSNLSKIREEFVLHGWICQIIGQNEKILLNHSKLITLNLFSSPVLESYFFLYVTKKIFWEHFLQMPFFLN